MWWIEDKFNYYFLERGVAEIYNDKVNILVEDAYPIEELKEDKLLSERKHLLEKLSTLDSLSDQYKDIQNKLKEIETKIEALKRSKS